MYSNLSIIFYYSFWVFCIASLQLTLLNFLNKSLIIIQDGQLIFSWILFLILPLIEKFIISPLISSVTYHVLHFDTYLYGFGTLLCFFEMPVYMPKKYTVLFTVTVKTV